MWQRMTFVTTVVLLGFSGGAAALFVRGMHAERGAMAGFVFVSALAVVQSWMVASAIAKARRLSADIRNACYRGTQAKFRAVSLIALCAIAGVLPMAFMGEHSGAQGRIATVMLGGVVFSTIAAFDRAACPRFADRRMKSVYCFGSFQAVQFMGAPFCASWP